MLNGRGSEVTKGWGKEIIIHNSKEYCGKILAFNEGKKMSMHYHMVKNESWYVARGSFIFSWIDTKRGEVIKKMLYMGDCVDIPAGLPHQLEALEYSEVFEVSTQHFDDDSYRIWKGD